MVAGLAKDETGGALFQAWTIATTAGIEVWANHHPIKGGAENKEPSKLRDVYGSRFITAAVVRSSGSGGRGRDPVVKFRHLKQPALEVGPFRLSIDHDRGDVSVERGTAAGNSCGSRRGG